MKTRQGFVSNSSSSSFMVQGPTTTAQVGLLMMYEIVSDRMEFPDSTVEDEIKAALKWLSENTQFNDPIVIPWSINYETFIWNDGADVKVDTCNNHSWDVLNPVYDGVEEYYENEHKKPDTYLDMYDMQLSPREGYWDKVKARWEARKKTNENS